MIVIVHRNSPKEKQQPDIYLVIHSNTPPEFCNPCPLIKYKLHTQDAPKIVEEPERRKRKKRGKRRRRYAQFATKSFRDTLDPRPTRRQTQHHVVFVCHTSSTLYC